MLVFLLFLLGFMLVFNLAESMWELDHWIATSEQRDRDGYDYENDQPVKPSVKLPEPVPQDVKKLTLSLENFPKNSVSAQEKIQKLLKKTQDKG